MIFESTLKIRTTAIGTGLVRTATVASAVLVMRATTELVYSATMQMNVSMSVVSTIVMTTDFAPTLIELMSIGEHEYLRSSYDGISLVPYLNENNKNNKAENSRQDMLIEYQGSQFNLTLRLRDIKFISKVFIAFDTQLVSFQLMMRSFSKVHSLNRTFYEAGVFSVLKSTYVIICNNYAVTKLKL